MGGTGVWSRTASENDSNPFGWSKPSFDAVVNRMLFGRAGTQMLKPLMRLLVVSVALAAVLAGTSSPMPFAPARSAAAVGDCVQEATGEPRDRI